MEMSRWTPPTILVVEDDPHLAEVLRIAFELAGYRVLTAPQGEAAIQLVAQEHPNLITLDLRLPDVDGHYVLEAIQLGGATPPIPVIILSGGHYRPCATDGVVAVLPKPFELADLAQTVQALLAPAPVKSREVVG